MGMGGHSHSHSHAHGDEQSKADWITTVGAVVEAGTSLISNSFWLGGWFDLALQFEADVLGLSYYGWAFGVFLALITAGGAAYSHSIVNINHQEDSKKPVNDQESKKELEALLNAVKDEIEKEEKRPQKNEGYLTWLQKIALLGDFISHIGEVSAPITFVIDLATKDTLSYFARVGSYLGASAVGFFGSWANVRTCAMNLKKFNQHKAETAAHRPAQATYHTAEESYQTPAATV